MYMLAIETSCDETAVCVLDVEKFLNGHSLPEEFLLADLISSQAKLHQPYGGVVPELAAREHITNLPPLVELALERAGKSYRELGVIAVTQGPGLNGCLLVGVSFAKGLSAALGIPLLALNHLEGHLMAGELLPPSERPCFPNLSLLVSGGHTLLVYQPSFRKYKILAKTRDDAAGEAFDKIASILKLPYPGGPALSRAAKDGNRARFSLPIALPKDGASFSFSGLKTAVLNLTKSLGEQVKEPKTVNDIAAAAEEAIVHSLVDKTLRACDELKPRSILLTGGVAANTVLRERLRDKAQSRHVSFAVPEPRWCTDNAAMMAVLGSRIIEQNSAKYLNWDASLADGLLGPGVPISVGSRPRFGIDELN